jgi:hypothetical protein
VPHKGALPNPLHRTSFHQRLHHGHPTRQAYPSKAPKFTKLLRSARSSRRNRAAQPIRTSTGP